MSQLIPAERTFEIALTGGLGEGGKLRACHVVSHTETAAIFPPNLSPERFVEYGLFLKSAGESLAFWRSCWLRHGHKHQSPELVAEQLEQLNFSFEEGNTMMALAFIPDEARNRFLSVQHHTVIGELMEQQKLDEAEAKRWLSIAQVESLSASELRDSITAGVVVRNPVAESSSNRGGMVSAHGIRTMFTRWQIAMEKQTPIEQMDPAIQEKIYEELKPILELGEKLKVTLKKT